MKLSQFYVSFQRIRTYYECSHQEERNALVVISYRVATSNVINCKHTNPSLSINIPALAQL
jgi:hypothetical protein